MAKAVSLVAHRREGDDEKKMKRREGEKEKRNKKNKGEKRKINEVDDTVNVSNVIFYIQIIQFFYIYTMLQLQHVENLYQNSG